MSSTKTNATAKPTGKSASAKKEIMENFFMKKAQGQREHEFAKGVNTAAEAALRGHAALLVDHRFAPGLAQRIQGLRVEQGVLMARQPLPCSIA